MYNGIGLQTPRGSGTNGYIQTNKFFVRPKTGRVAETTKGFQADQGTAGVTKKPNVDILEHDRKRQIELKIAVLEDKLTDQGYTEAEIEEKIKEARITLEAAAASEESGGPTAIVVADNKFSDTQTHQIAARKEKQMETLKAALGIGISEFNEQTSEGSDDDDLRNNRKKGPKDSKLNEKHEHVFLDRGISGKKRMMEDLKVEKSEKKKGVKDHKNYKNESERDGYDESRHHKEEKNRRRRHGSDSSDTDSNEKPAKGIQKKNRKGDLESDHENDSGVDIGKKHVISKKYMKRRTRDSDDSDSNDDSDVDVGKKKHKTSKKYKKHSTRDSDDSDSKDDSDVDVGKKKHKTSKKNKKHRTLDSDDSDSDTNDDDIGKGSSKKAVEKSEKARARHDSDDDAVFDEGLSRGRTQKGKEHVRISRRHDSEDESDIDSGKEKNRSAVGTHHRRKERSGLNNDDGVDALRIPEESSLYKSRRDNVDASSYGSQELMRGKRKLVDGNRDEQPESKSRNRNSGKETERTGEHLKDTKIESELNSRAYRNKDDQKDDRSRLISSGGGHVDENIERGGRIRSNDDEPQRGSRRNDRDYEEHGGRKRSRDEDEHRGRKHRIVEEDVHRYRRHGKDDGELERGSRRHGRGDEEERESKGHERDRQTDYSKRARYDDARSSERRRYENEKRDDDRARR